ncbi:phosphotransferase [Aminipila terrae]|uniref:Phosphotransferase n=1 Tax=Aminipila terrae TaxID=2697030 RepID=A0A6P1M9F1_9FIRM|nr:phosphotransferase [Aminipila terrae]QHI71240.1 phosphotransferase [Aminipila terrae]
MIDYLKQNTDILCGAENINSRAFENKDSESGSGDGYVNFVFCVSYYINNKNKSVVIKQARPYSKHIPLELPAERNKLEYEAIRVKRALVPEYLPELYYLDEKNHIFIMESFTEWKILRYQFNKMKKQKKLAEKIGEFLAVSNFFTSEIYLETGLFRKIERAFCNCAMRQIMENGIFIPEFQPIGEVVNRNNDPDLYAISRNIWEDRETIAQCYVMRDIYMHKGECLIHGDFHTSNIFIKDDKMKVIDMEYAFIGPYSYDLGYLINNFISQYAACPFKPEKREGQSGDFANYLLESIKEIYISYVKIFDTLWDRFGKAAYSFSREYRKEIYVNLLQEMLGFAAVANISRITVLTGFPDFDIIEDREKHIHAKRLSLIISQYLLKERKKYTDIDHVIKDMEFISKGYLLYV